MGVFSASATRPKQVVLLNSAADGDGLVHVPELIYVAHDVDVIANGLPQRPHAQYLFGRGVFGAHLRLHLLEPFLHQRRADLGQLLQVHGTHQRAAGVGGNPLAVAAQQRTHRLVKRLALDVPQCHVHRGHG